MTQKKNLRRFSVYHKTIVPNKYDMIVAVATWLIITGSEKVLDISCAIQNSSFEKAKDKKRLAEYS